MKLQIAMLKSNNFLVQYRIYYEDSEVGGVVYYANYLKFFERARTEFLRHLGISQQKFMNEEKQIFEVRRCELDFISPARLDDLVDISVMLEEMGAARITMKQEMSRNDKVLARLRVEIVCVGVEDFKPKKIEERVRSALKTN